MIYESVYWKKDLLKIARRLGKRKSLMQWNETDHGEFEKDIMIGFYVIRKLAEAKKLSVETLSAKIIGSKIPHNGRGVHYFSRSRFVDCYNFENCNKTKFEISFLWNQLIHSYIFDPYFCHSSGNLLGVYFTSDTQRNKYLFSLDIDTVIGLFKTVGKDYPMHISINYDESKKDYIFLSKKHPENPPLENLSTPKGIL